MNLKKPFALLMALCALFLCACGQQAVETAPTTEAPTVPTTVATIPTEPVPTVKLHSGLREDGSFDEGTLFIGDSLTNALVFDYLMLYEHIGDARYMAIVGAPVQAYFDGPSLNYEMSAIFSADFLDLTFSQGVEKVGEEITAVYFMMGSNHSFFTTYETYDKIVAHLLEYCPNATIYLQKIPYSTSESVEYELVNGILEDIHAQYAESVDCRVLLVDTFEAIGDRLFEDGVHVNYEGQEVWYQTLVDFAEENNIPQ